jgi:hypothetical protein
VQGEKLMQCTTKARKAQSNCDNSLFHFSRQVYKAVKSFVRLFEYQALFGTETSVKRLNNLKFGKELKQ